MKMLYDMTITLFIFFEKKYQPVRCAITLRSITKKNHFVSPPDIFNKVTSLPCPRTLWEPSDGVFEIALSSLIQASIYWIQISQQ